MEILNNPLDTAFALNAGFIKQGIDVVSEVLASNDTEKILELLNIERSMKKHGR